MSTLQLSSVTADHRTNRLLAALEPEDFARLEPHLELVNLTLKQVLYEMGDTITYAYFPHDAIISLVNVMEDGHTVEISVFGREGVSGVVSALVTREAFGRYVVQMSGTATRVPYERLNQVRENSPQLQQLILRYGEALLTQTFQTVSCNAVHSVEARCCRWILSMHDRADHDSLPLTHEFLAEMLAWLASATAASGGSTSACCPARTRSRRRARQLPWLHSDARLRGTALARKRSNGIRGKLLLCALAPFLLIGRRYFREGLPWRAITSASTRGTNWFPMKRALSSTARRLRCKGQRARPPRLEQASWRRGI
jgi:CRP-like cAMP-binding protein